MNKRTIRALVLAFTAGIPMVLAAVPRDRITNDTALYQDLHEINVKKIKHVSFDSDLKRLSALEKSHHEALPVSVSGPMQRIQKTPYKYSRKSRRR